jgi:hypothetical protein
LKLSIQINPNLKERDEMTLYFPTLVISYAHITHGQSVRHGRAVHVQLMDSPWTIGGQSEITVQTSKASADFAIYTDGPRIPGGRSMPPFLCHLEKLQLLTNLMHHFGSLLKIIPNTFTNTINSIITIVKMS